MSAPTLEKSENTDQLPGWIFPPRDGFTADDLDKLPQIPPHTELIDGSLVLVSPQTYPHSLVVDLLTTQLRRTAPTHYMVGREMTIILGPRQRPEPDVIVIKAHAALNEEETAFQGADVVLAVEVVSKESEIRDRERKPVLYAQAGIRFFWRVEFEDKRPVVYTYELDPATKAYSPTGVYRDQLKIALPYDIEIDLTKAQRLWVTTP